MTTKLTQQQAIRPVQILQQPTLLLFLLVVLIAPWPLGSNRDFLWPAITVPLCLLAAVLLWRPVPANWPRLCAAALLALMLWLGLQTFGIPGLFAPLTLDVEASQRDLLLTVGYASAFFVALQLITTRPALVLLMSALLLGAGLQLLAGIWQVTMMDYPSASGSFASPNHFAAFMYLSLLPVTGWVATATKARLFVPIVLVVMLTAVIISESRMGLAAALLGSTSAGIYHVLGHRFIRPVVATIGIGCGVVIGIVLILWATSGTPSPDSESRIHINKTSLQIIADHGVLGTGAGTFPQVFAAYRSQHIFDRVTYAENDYFEFVIELGIPGAMALLLLMFSAVHQQCRLIVMSVDNSVGSIATGCLAACIALLCHSLADFNLQIPANALVAILILALPFSAALQSPQSIYPD